MSTPTVGAYVKVPADCDISYSFEAGGDIAIQLGSLRDGFELIWEREALERLAKVAEHALAAPADPDREQTLALLPVAVV